MLFSKSILWGALLVFSFASLRGADDLKPAAGRSRAESLFDVMPAAQWKELEKSVDRALAWLATQQAADGSFNTYPSGQPAVTSLCVLAFLSRGHVPGYGPYGHQLEKAIDFVVSCQMPDGLFSYQPPQPMHESHEASHTATYNHAIAGLMLGEVFGHVTGKRMEDVKQAVLKALAFTRALQTRPKSYAADRGGWRYLRLRFDHTAEDSDLSVTSWQLMFLRSARNAEFNVPQQYIDDAMAYVHRSFDPGRGVFVYAVSGGDAGIFSRGMVGAGIVSLSLAGEHQSPMALAAGDWLLAHPFRSAGEHIGPNDRFYYGIFYCSQGAAQLGGRYWRGIFPGLVNVMVRSQQPDGSWPMEGGLNDEIFGPVFPTAMAVLALTPGYQLLPVYQR